MQSKNDANLSQSASGGVCTEAFMRTIGKNMDVIVGAAYDDDFNVVHTECITCEQVKRLSGSKYVQSDTAGIYVKIEQALKQGKNVCFSGTPCQVAGLHSFLGKNYANLVTIDFLCHSVPSPRAWKVYLKNQEKKLGKIVNVRFKSKKYGYSFPTLELTVEKNGRKKSYYFTSQADGFMSAFLHGSISRESCKNCQFRDCHCSDLTVADYYRFSEISSEFKSDAGISRVIAWTDEGVAFVDLLKEYFVWKDVACDKIFLKDDFHDVKAPGVIKEQEFSDAYILQHCLKVSAKQKLISVMRIILHKMGLQEFIKKVIKG
jgi:coenzyme F420-reducing hydrogenase beta subunit